MLTYLSLFPDMLEDHFQDLTDEEVGILVRAAMRYAFEGTEPAFEPRSVLSLTWRRLREHVDKCSAAAAKMADLGKRSAAARSERSIARQTSSATADAVAPSPEGKACGDERAATAVDSSTVQQATSGNGRTPNTQSQSHTQSQSQSQSQAQSNVSADADTAPARAKASSRFTPPTIHEVMAYCQERGGLVNPQQWYAYYSANGWRVGRNPMKDWKAAVRTWESNGVGNGTRAAPAADYQRRTHTAEELRGIEVDLDGEAGT